MAKNEDHEQRTIETRLQADGVGVLLDDLLSYYSSLRHRLWRDLVIKELPLNELKSSYIKSYGVTARQFNSLAKDVSAKAKAMDELYKENLKSVSTRVGVQKKSVETSQKRLKVVTSTLTAILTFRKKIGEWKLKSASSNRPIKKPLMPKCIQGQFRERLLKELCALRFAIHMKKRRLSRLEEQWQQLKDKARPSVCFGSKKKFKAQFHLMENGYGQQEQWLNDFRTARSSQMTFIGSSDESFGNQTVQYDLSKKTLALRLPNAPQFAKFGKALKLQNVIFPDFLLDAFTLALSSPDFAVKKSQKSRLPVTYRFVRRINPKTQAKAYYLQASFALKAPPIQSLDNVGVMGVDLNADHLAVTETDRFGNWIDSFILPFDLRNLTSEQAKAIIGDLVATLVEQAKTKGKPIALEELDFSQKKRALKLLPKCRRRYLSQFAYAQFMKASDSKARAEGIRVLFINPAYTSLIGAYKYQGLNISSHEKAALSIARRAQGYTEGLNVFQGTLPSQAMMTEKTTFMSSSRHVWGFYSDHQKLIRKLFIDDKPRPLLPLGRAISLATYKTSLKRSLIVTREKRDSGRLRCRLG